MKKSFIGAWLGLLLSATVPALASEWITEQPGEHLNQMETELHGVLGTNALGGGIRIGLPVISQGFVPSLNNNVMLSLGVDFLNWPSSDYAVTGMVIPIMLQWNFFLTRRWSLFGEGGVAVQDWFSRRANGDDQTLFIWPGLAAGARFYFNDGQYPALLLRVGYPSGLSVGIGF